MLVAQSSEKWGKRCADETGTPKHASTESPQFLEESENIEFTGEMREELLDPEGWSEVLGTYARTVGLAVALTDCEGRQLGVCLNPQPAWLIADGARAKQGGSENECPFCLDPPLPCEAVKIALAKGRVQIVHDGAGLVHFAVPLSLGQHQLGAVIAGQVFDQYPEHLRLVRLGRYLSTSVQDLWSSARLQSPIRAETLRVYGELLLSLSRAFLRQRYAAILDRKLARVNLRLQLLLSAVQTQALFTVDETGLVTSWNSGAEHIFGYTANETIGHNFSGFFAPEDITVGTPAKLIEQAIRAGYANDQGWQVRKDGTRFFAEGSLAVLGHGGSREFGRITHDVTDRRKSEEALRETHKLESIGLLASGIAHDFNNLLSAIMSGVSFARTSLPVDHLACSSLAIAEQASERAAALTHQLLAYAGHGKFVVTQFDLSVLIKEMLKLLQTSIPKSVDLQLALRPDLPWIEADASQIQQVVMNLVINGVESIGPEGGSLQVSTGTAPLMKTAGGISGIEVFMEIRDSGSGMTDETKARIFDPFFTTKFTGRGLGLAAVSGIVRGHAGRMSVESALGKGTTFRISFPGIERRSQPPEICTVPIKASGIGTVLVVDDETGLRILAQKILERCGYQVRAAADGREAVEVFRQNSQSITAILLDMTMPVMGGEEAFRLIRAIRSDVPIVISTGYSEVTIRELFEAGTAIGFVQKPYTAERLCETIHMACSTGTVQ